MAGPADPPRLLLEGRPGSGKTAAVARLVELLRREGLALTGFLTRELRERGAHVGFTLETLDGRRGMLAQVSVRGGPVSDATASPTTTSNALRSRRSAPTRTSSWSTN